MTFNGEVEGPLAAVRSEPRAHTVFSRSRRHYRPSRTLQRWLDGFEAALMPNPRNTIERIKDITTVVHRRGEYPGVAPAILQLVR